MRTLDPRGNEAALGTGQDLARLRSDIGEAAVDRCVLAYLKLLAGRLDRIQRAVGTGATADAIDAALDLGVSSTMLGALRLAALARELESFLRVGLLAEGAVTLSAARAEAAGVAAALRAVLDRGGPDFRPPHGPPNR